MDLFTKSHVARTVVILGNTRIGKILAREIEARRQLGYRLVGLEPTEQRRPAVGESFSPGQTSYLASSFDGLIRDNWPLTLVIDAAESLPLVPDQLLQMRAMGIGVSDCESFYELITGKLPVSELRHSWLVFAPGFVLHDLDIYPGVVQGTLPGRQALGRPVPLGLTDGEQEAGLYKSRFCSVGAT